MRSRRRRAIASTLAAWLLSGAPAAGQTGQPGLERRDLVAALERLMATGEPRHLDHDEGQRLKEAVQAALAQGDRDLERLAVRAASPLVGAMSRPVSPVTDLPSLGLQSWSVLDLPQPVAYRARVFGSLDGGPEHLVATVRSGGNAGTTVRGMFGTAGARPGVHVVHLRAELTFGDRTSGVTWTEERTLTPTVYALYDPQDETSAGIRGLLLGPAATPVRQFDAALGDEPLGAWLQRVLASRRQGSDSGPDWLSQYCHERTGEAGDRTPGTAICAVAYFQSAGQIGQIWFRTADVQDGERGPEWVMLNPARFEGFVVRESSPDSHTLSALPSVLDMPAESRPLGDVSVTPADIEVIPADASPGAPMEARVTVRNSGTGDLFKVLVDVSWATDLAVRGTSRRFVVDIPAHDSVTLTTDVTFPAGYGYVIALASQLGEHAPHDSWTPDPTPYDECAARVVTARRAPAGYGDAIGREAGGCSVK